VKAYHVTERSRLSGLLARGMAPGSCWATRERLVAYYAEDYEDPAVIEIDTDAFGPGHDGFDVDHPSIAEPITPAIGLSESEVHRRWKTVDGSGTWSDCEALVGSFVIGTAIGPDKLRLNTDLL
jgi:hypothetical protein